MREGESERVNSVTIHVVVVYWFTCTLHVLFTDICQGTCTCVVVESVVV